MKDSVTVTTSEASLRAGVARPRGGPATSIAVLHEIFGIDAGMGGRCNDPAAAGAFARHLEA